MLGGDRAGSEVPQNTNTNTNTRGASKYKYKYTKQASHRCLPNTNTNLFAYQASLTQVPQNTNTNTKQASHRCLSNTNTNLFAYQAGLTNTNTGIRPHRDVPGK